MNSTYYQRVLPLEGGCNFRDLGGYRTIDGRRIRQGALFRSGVMSYFTPGDHPCLTALELRTICDLRRADEREKEPTRWPAEINMVSWDEEQPHLAQIQSKMVEQKTIDGERARKVMINAYRAMSRSLQTQLQGILGRMAAGEVPLLFHCAAGKDRTGFSAAIVLHTLGVPRETIFEDYELTNRAVNLNAFMLKHQSAALGVTDGEHPLVNMEAGVRDALLTADRDYLSASFEQIEMDHDSVDNYVRDRLGISDLVKQRIRNALLIG